MKTLLRTILSSVLKLLPAGAPERIYATLFRGALGRIVNPMITLLLPENVQLPEGILVLNRSDPAVSGASAFGVYEPYESALFRDTITPGMTIVDIGANIGYYTVIAAGRTGEVGRVIAFEPAPENYATLQKTISANNFPHVDIHQMAIADKKGTLSLNLYESNKGKHSLVKGSDEAKGFSTSVQVETTTLDAFLMEHGITNVDVIKMDIEGAESLALEGMRETLRKARYMFMEFTPSAIRKVGHDPKDVLMQMRESGFTIYAIHERTKSKDLVVENAAFIQSIPDDECANLYCEK